LIGWWWWLLEFRVFSVFLGIWIYDEVSIIGD
jgi:hypothetical protein